MHYVLKEPSGSYFVDPSFNSWALSKSIEKATKFSTREQAEAIKKQVDLAVATTYWDYDDTVPWPTIVEVTE